MPNIQWNPINANFGNAASFMDAATKNISQAGTIFGQLRQAILDEEQRTVDNAYREKTFNENVRQFGLKHALEQDTLEEKIRANKALEENTRRGQDLNYKSSMASIGIQNARLAFDKNKWNAQQNQINNDRKILSNIYKSVLEPRNKLDNEITLLENQKNTTLDSKEKDSLQNQIDILKTTRRTQYSASALDNDIKTEAAKQGILLNSTAFTKEADNEIQRLNKNKELQLKNKEAQIKNISEASKMIKDLNLTVGQQEKVVKALTRAVEMYPNTPPNVLASVITDLPNYNAWWNWDAKNALEIDNTLFNSSLDDFIEGKDLNNNELNRMFASKAIIYERNKK